MGLGSLTTAVLGTVLVVKGGAFILGGGALMKLKALGGIILKKSGGKALYAKLLKWYKGFELNRRMMNADLTNLPGVSKKGQLIREGNKILKQIKSEPIKQPRFTKESLRLLDEALKRTQIRIDPSKSGFRKFYKSKKLRDLLRRRTDDERLLKEGEQLADKIDLLEQIRKVPFDDFAEGVLKKTERLKILDFIKKIDKDIINKNLRSDNTIIKEGDNYFANNLGGRVVVTGGEPDPYLASLNTIKAYSELTA